MGFSIEPLGDSHKKEVIDIFNYYISASFAAYPEREVPYGFFDQLLEMCRNYPAVAARDQNGRIVGFGLLRPYHFASTFRRTAEISYFLLPDATGRGLGTKILRHIEKEAAGMGIDSILASISSRNEESLCFHRKHGFVECGRLKDVGRKFAEDFDVVWMQKRLA